MGAVLVRQGEERLFIREVVPGLAAARAQLLEGDEILMIDGVDVRGLSDKQLAQLLEGEAGTRLKLTIVRDDEILRFDFERSPAISHRVH